MGKAFMKTPVSAEPRRRGRPHKFGRPSHLVTVTLPGDVVRRLRSVNRDLAHAIVEVVESLSNDEADQRPDTELVRVADGQSLIVVNSTVIRSLPGVTVVSLQGTRAFLALEPGRGVSDLELAVIDRLDEALDARERQALKELRHMLKNWRRDPALRFHGRTIIIVEAVTPSPRGRERIPPRRGGQGKQTVSARSRSIGQAVLGAPLDARHIEGPIQPQPVDRADVHLPLQPQHVRRGVRHVANPIT